jgi:hypothetical protein
MVMVSTGTLCWAAVVEQQPERKHGPFLHGVAHGAPFAGAYKARLTVMG